MKNKKNLLSIIVPVHNGEKTIQKCIDSILQQSINNFTLYIVNDGSTDNTEKVLKKYNDINNVTVINKKNEGVAKARNCALEKVNSEYVAFVDADDYVDKNFLWHLIDGITKSDVDIVISGYNEIKDGVKTISHVFSRAKVDNEMIITDVLKENGIQGYLWNKLFKVKIIKKNHLKFEDNLHMAEDLLFCVNYMSFIKKALILPYHDYNYVQYNDSLSKQASIFNTNDNYEKAYMNYIASLLRIEDVIPEKCKKVLYARICRTYGDVLRAMKLNNSTNYELYKDIHNKAIREKKYLFASNIISKKQKIYFFATLYFPKLVYQIDKRRFR